MVTEFQKLARDGGSDPVTFMKEVVKAAAPSSPPTAHVALYPTPHGGFEVVEKLGFRVPWSCLVAMRPLK